jgi:molybdopterin-guanine dinucleotide biosynthesis protein A
VLALSEVCDDVILVCAPGTEPDVPVDASVRVVRDSHKGEGPLAGVHDGLMAAVRSEVAVVVGGDMPRLQPEVLRQMLRATEEGVDAVGLVASEQIRPLPCVLRTWSAAEAAHALLHAGRRSLLELLQALKVKPIEESAWTALDPQRLTLFDVDFPKDLEG